MSESRAICATGLARASPGRGCGEGTGQHLDPRAEGEDAAAQRVLEMLPPEDAPDELGHFLAVEGVDAPGLSELRLVGGIRALHGAVRGGAGVEHLLPAS